jgi:aspartyl protease family protein
MRHIWVDVRIGSEDCSKITEVRALVDTGATLTIIPRSLAIDLGVRVTGKSRVETGVGVIELDRSRAYIEVMGREV